MCFICCSWLRQSSAFPLCLSPRGQPGAASLWRAWIKPLTSEPLFCVSSRLLLTDTASKLQAAKDKARQANDTAKDVLAQIKDLHQNLDGLEKNYKQLADSVAKTNAVVKDPSKNSKISFFTLIIALLSSHSISILGTPPLAREGALLVLQAALLPA